MEKRHVCFTCYQYHPEMKGVSEEEFKAGNNVCREEKCTCKGQELEAVEHCQKCDRLFRVGEHVHDKED